MKKIISLLYLFVCLNGFSQRIQDFNLSLITTSVNIRFSISAGSQCGGYSILYSTDSVFYSTLYSYPGICGDLNNKQDYSYVHVSPAYNQYNYYKVELLALETSPAKKIFVSEQSRSNMMLYPNPIHFQYDILSLKIFNSNNLRVAGFLYNQFGKPIRSVDLTTIGDTGTLNISDITNGLYILWLTDGTVAYSSKFIINR